MKVRALKLKQRSGAFVDRDGTIYAFENDNPHRSGYLWEIRP